MIVHIVLVVIATLIALAGAGLLIATLIALVGAGLLFVATKTTQHLKTHNKE